MILKETGKFSDTSEKFVSKLVNECLISIVEKVSDLELSGNETDELLVSIGNSICLNMLGSVLSEDDVEVAEKIMESSLADIRKAFPIVLKDFSERYPATNVLN